MIFYKILNIMMVDGVDIIELSIKERGMSQK